jgi:hypothetical protein
MEPLHFWWLVAARDEADEARSGAMSENEKRELLDLMIESGFTW